MINKYEDTIAIAVFGYNRPKELEKTLSRLSTFTNLSIYKTKVIVFIDGPKNQNDKKRREEILSLRGKFLDFDFKISDVNRGLKNSIYKGIDKIAHDFEYFFVFEDDIILLANLDDIISRVLNTEIFEDYSSVCLYCPFGINVRNFFKQVKFIETYRMQCWGWFSSAKNWNYFRSKCTDSLLKSIDKEEYIIEIGADSYLRLQETLFQNKALWANQWIGFNKIINKPSLVLSSSFTSNIGIGTGSNKFSQLSIIKEKMNFYVSKFKLIILKHYDLQIRKITNSELNIITNRRIF